MTANKLITISLYNRPKYTAEVLNHLVRCNNIKEYLVLPLIDLVPNDVFRTNQNHIFHILHRFASAGALNIDKPVFADENFGCNGAIWSCLNMGFSKFDFLIHLEDDICLAKDALEYFEWANQKYKDDKSIFTIDAYNNTRYDDSIVSKVSEIAYQVCKTQSFKPWGWATWIDRWEGIRDSWQFGYEARPKQGFAGGGWDVCMKQLLRGDRYRIYPKIARCINIGAKGGCHTPSEEWHKDKHDIPYWADNLTYSKQDFKEVPNE